MCQITPYTSEHPTLSQDFAKTFYMDDMHTWARKGGGGGCKWSLPRNSSKNTSDGTNFHQNRGKLKI